VPARVSTEALSVPAVVIRKSPVETVRKPEAAVITGSEAPASNVRVVKVPVPSVIVLLAIVPMTGLVSVLLVRV